MSRSIHANHRGRRRVVDLLRLVARVKVILRRPRQEKAKDLVFHDDQSVTFDGRRVPLTQVEFRLLRALAATPGRVLSRDKLLAGLYDDHRVVTDRTVDTHVKNLRKKLATARPDAEIVHSIYGVGYKLEL